MRMMFWKIIYWKQEIFYPFWCLLLGGYITLIMINPDLLDEWWWMLIFIIFWINVNRIIFWYCKKTLKNLEVVV